MVDEARVEPTDNGKAAKSDGWFILNTREARWRRSEEFGLLCTLEGEPKFPSYGINVRVVQPGQPASLYHSENAQENFLILSGEALVVVENQERRLTAGDFVHFPPGTNHVLVGAGDGPCAILMMGFRPAEKKLLYPVSEVAAKHGASAVKETSDPREAYAGMSFFTEPGQPSWPPAE